MIHWNFSGRMPLDSTWMTFSAMALCINDVHSSAYLLNCEKYAKQIFDADVAEKYKTFSFSQAQKAEGKQTHGDVSVRHHTGDVAVVQLIHPS